MKRETINVFAVGDPAVKAYTMGRNSIIQRWEEKSFVKVNFEIVPWQDYYPKLIKELENPEAFFDVIMVAGHLWKADFVEKGYLQDLDEYFMSCPSDYDRADILESVRNEMCFNRKKYLVPSFSDGHIIFYQKDIINDAIGGDLPTVISTQDYVELAKKTHRKREDVYGIALKAHRSEILLDWLPYLRQEGIDLFQDGRPSFNSPKGIAALENYIAMKKYASPNTADFGNNEIKNCIQNGACVLAVSWGGQAGEIFHGSKNKENMGFATFEYPWNVTWSFGINKRSYKKKMAADLLFYLSSKEIDREVGLYAGSPLRKSSYNYPEAATRYPWYNTQLTMLNRSKPLPDIANSGELFGFLYQYVHRCFVGELNAAAALEKAEDAIKVNQCRENLRI
jgi:multiple sugar transport system substrate-binding protein